MFVRRCLPATNDDAPDIVGEFYAGGACARNE
jgi:hypothetical protein